MNGARNRGNTHGAHFSWPQEAREFAAAKRREGWSHGKIAAALSEQHRHPVSRNAVIGQLIRQGVKGPPGPVQRKGEAGKLIWSPELDKTLLELRAGHTIASTAAAMGRSPNTIASRLQVLRNQGVAIVARPRTRPDVAVRILETARAERAVRLARADPEAVLEAPQPGGAAFFKLRPHHCRWPLWTEHRAPPADRQFYCGANVASGSWCSDHHRRSVSNAA